MLTIQCDQFGQFPPTFSFDLIGWVKWFGAAYTHFHTLIPAFTCVFVIVIFSVNPLNVT